MSDNVTPAFVATSSISADLNAGMTTRVFRGSMWSVSGQAAILLASLIATPFAIRLLGSESYGVLVLINPLIGYAAIADLGMGQASIRFSADAHGRGDEEQEKAILWTAAFVMSAATVAVCIALFIAARPLVEYALRLPEHLRAEATLALRVSCAGLFARGLAGVFSSPQLVRMRLDLYSLINTGGAVAQIGLVPIVLLLGGSLVFAIAVVSGVNVGIAGIHLVMSLRLAPGLMKPSLERGLAAGLVSFGLSTCGMMLVGMLLFNAERLFVTRMSGVTVLGYYAVAFTIARLLAIFPAALGQPLLPAFARLHASDGRKPLQLLYERALRGLLLWTAPMAVVICTGAKPFLSLWAGSDYARESALPLCVLAVGCFFDGLSYVPRILLGAVGKPHLILKYQSLNLIPYLIVAAMLIPWLGATGAAIAWSIRATVECALMLYIAKFAADFRPLLQLRRLRSYALASTLLFVPLLLLILSTPPMFLMIASTIALSAYSALVWFSVLTPEEREWLTETVLGKSRLRRSSLERVDVY